MENSPLSLLPAELRNEIYALVLFVNSINSDGLKLRTAAHRGSENRFLALTQTCRQIRHETDGMFFSLNRFHIEVRDTLDFTDPLGFAIMSRVWAYELKTTKLASSGFLAPIRTIGAQNAAALRALYIMTRIHGSDSVNARNCATFVGQLEGARNIARANKALNVFVEFLCKEYNSHLGREEIRTVRIDMQRPMASLDEAETRFMHPNVEAGRLIDRCRLFSRSCCLTSWFATGDHPFRDHPSMIWNARGVVLTS